MLHYTLNTAHTFDCSSKEYSRDALKLLRPLAGRAIAEGQTQTALPAPLDSFSAKVTCTEGAALFDVFDPEQSILSTNAVAWQKGGDADCWSQFESLYLRLSRQFEMALGRAPEQPKSLPWLVTLILPNPRISSLSWLADFEQCLALTLIDASKPKQSKPRGFGL